jgi:iron complex outermembrane recepter protein
VTEELYHPHNKAIQSFEFLKNLVSFKNVLNQKTMTKHYLRRLVPLFIFQAMALGALAQTSISGKVSDAVSGDPVPGVNIVVKGTVLGVTSDKDGLFSMSVKSSPPLTLSVSYIGYKPQEVTVSEANVSNLEIKMEEESTSLNEVVVSVSRKKP